MRDNRMTDKEIIKALECLEGCDLNCRDCPYSQGSFYPICQRRVAKDALNLINLQQEQLEAAIAGQETLQKALDEKDKELIRLNKEVDRLSQYVLYNEEYINDHYWDFCSISGCERVSNDCWKTCPYSRYSKVKSKIIKEFAERLKKECLIDRGYEILYEGTIDNLVKKMTEVDE